MVNEKYNSEYYVVSSPFSQLPMYDELEGFIVSNAITDANTALAAIKIPGALGRDLSDYIFYKEGDIEYLKAQATILVSEDGIPALPVSSFETDINGSGYANWYKIGKDAENKKIKVKLPDKASFSVYNASGGCIMNSYVYKQNTVTLPQGGYIVFAGDVNSHFSVSYVK